MARGGARPGAGRKPGIPNRATTAARNAFTLLFEKKSKDLEKMIDETRFGNDNRPGDPGKAADLMLKLAEFCLPKLGRVEVTGQGGGPVEFTIRDLGKEG